MDKYRLRFSFTRENVVLGHFFHEKLWEFPGQGLFSCLITSCLFRLLLCRSGHSEPVKEGLDALSSNICVALREQIFHSSSSNMAHLLQRQDNDVGFHLLSALSGRWCRTLAPADLLKNRQWCGHFTQISSWPSLRWQVGAGFPEMGNSSPGGGKTQRTRNAAASVWVVCLHMFKVCPCGGRLYTNTLHGCRQSVEPSRWGSKTRANAPRDECSDSPGKVRDTAPFGRGPIEHSDVPPLIIISSARMMSAADKRSYHRTASAKLGSAKKPPPFDGSLSTDLANRQPEKNFGIQSLT